MTDGMPLPPTQGSDLEDVLRWPGHPLAEIAVLGLPIFDEQAKSVALPI